MSARGKHFAVVGGGLSGMTAALLLARHGFTVTLIEKRNVLGPTLRGFSRRGVHFDTGLHYAGGLSPNGPLTRYFRLLGLDDLPLVAFNQECFDRIRFVASGREICLPVGHAAMADALCMAFPAESAFIRAYLEKLEKAFFASAFLNFDGDWRATIDAALHAESLDAVLRKGTNDAMLRTVLSIHSLLYGVSPLEAPFLQHARIAGSYLDGVKTVAGGGGALVAALERRLAAEGVTVLCGVAVEGFRASPAKEITGIVLADERILPVDGVVYTAHPALLPAMFAPGVIKPAFATRMVSLEDTFSTFTLFCANMRPLPRIRNSNLFICPEESIEAGFAPDCTPENGPFYISGCTRNADSPGDAACSFIAFAPGSVRDFAPWKNSRTGRRPEAYTQFKAEKLASVWENITRHFPEAAEAAVYDGATPLTNRDYLGSPNCGLYGAKHSIHQFSPLPITRVVNLWMAGQSVIAPGILGAIISGVVACGFIVGMDVLHKEVAACG